jgi:hypothetical protein
VEAKAERERSSMSANRDTSQKTTFVYSNLYQLYRKGKEAAEQAAVPASETQASLNNSGNTTVRASEPVAANPAESVSDLRQAVFQLPNPMGTLASEKNVLKTGDLKADAAPAISAYQPPSLLAKRIVEKPQALKQVQQNAMPAQSAAIESLKANLKTLNDLHARLKFMLEELQELVKE